MSWKEFTHNRWTRFTFWALLYILWVIWLGNFWWLFGLGVIFDIFITKKVRWNFWKKENKEGEKHSTANDWLDAVVFAVIVVTFINIFFFQAFKIPSSSMERSLYTGDHLFVSKLTYGPRIPETPLTIPFTHNVIFGHESYSKLIHRPYRRLAGFREVRAGDCVVFGFPNGDTVLRKAPMEDYHSLVRLYGREQVIDRLGPIVVRPSDKKDHYVKRCVAVAGDTLEVRDGKVWVNGEKQTEYPGVQYSYSVVTNGQRINPKAIERLGINASELYFNPALPGYPAMPLTAQALEQVEELGGVVEVRSNLETAASREVFPFDGSRGWSRDQFGPLWIPARGATVGIGPDNIALYERIIRDYEHHSLEICSDGSIRIDGKEADSYTFAQDYYFMMGDNRHNSLDSRYWGFVPEDHVVGRPAIVWLSTDGSRKFPAGIRWRRFFKLV